MASICSQDKSVKDQTLKHFNPLEIFDRMKQQQQQQHRDSIWT